MQRKPLIRIKLAALALSLLASVAVSGCADQSGADMPQQEKITLSFRHFWVDEHDLKVANTIEAVINNFETTHPHVKIEFEGMNQTIYREQKLKSEMVAGNPPDIIPLFGGGEIEPYVRAGRLVDLTDFLEQNGLKSAFKNLDLWTFHNKVYGLPMEGNAEPLYYNKKIFASLHLNPPKTIDDLFAAIPVLKKAGYIPFALQNKDRWTGAIFYHYFLQRYGGNERIENILTKDGSFVNADYLQATKDFAKLIELGAFPDGANELTKEYAVNLFTSRKAAMYLNGSWDIGLFQGNNADLLFRDEVGVVNFPVAPVGKEDAGALAGGYTFGIGLSANLKGARLKAAEELLKAIYTEEVQRELVYEAMRIPSMNISFDAAKTGPIFPQVIDLIEHSKHTFIPYDNILPPEVKQTFLEVVKDLIDQTTTPEAVLAKLQESLELYRSLVQDGKH
ncbi:MAG TPA: extracellular solute-binding protein [Bacilli bacterium]